MRGCVVITNQIMQVRVRKSSLFSTCSGVAGRSFFFFFLNHRFLCPSNSESDNTNSFSKLKHEVEYTGDQFLVQGEKPYTLS